ncbi:Suppressor of profilin deletion [Cercospora beticola]|uniref:Suppressor of profilin deletion n=1 Tax=Cercospora beticola TaxID=122368 RepID=A0A2G5HTL4_CERBT|nr:Suppressor of profilin deletion [Cercospora beticola]PIA95884.1 Suppressor of profilin deletion [Cercospora beticola]WPB06918.1 hypothetical protein RHO25_011578 [Cercospora beticola]CAK1366846.1 unnamed protein product [Cercospora beticola]
MASTTDRSDYPALLQKVQPTQAVDILNDRVTQIKRLNITIADWLQERSKLEEQYAAGLRRLARKPIGDEDLGIFTVPWGSLTSSMEALAESHTSLASRIEIDVEKPLREFANNNRDIQAMPTIQGNLTQIAKEIEKAQKAAEKLQGKGESADANKVANASSDLENARAQWNSQAPFVFDNLQTLDETRLNQLRDALTQFVTLDVDQNEKSRGAGEQALNVLLNVEPADEIKMFAIKAANRRQSEVRHAHRASMFVPSSSSGAQQIPDDAPGSTPEPQKKGGFKGLKRLGTVMSRRSSKQPQQLPTTEESPERKPKSSPFGRLGRNKNSYSMEPPQEEAESSSRRPTSSFRQGSEISEVPRTQESAMSSSQAPQLGPIPHINGSGSGPTSATSALAPAFPSMVANGSHQNDLADLEPPRAVQPPPEPRRDNEGFSVPPQQLDPISQAQADAAELGDRQEPQFNVNIRNAPIQEEGADAALASMANKLAPPPTQKRGGTIRGRRDNRNSAIVSTYGAPDGFSSDTANSTTSLENQRSEPFAPAPVATSPPAIAPAVIQSPAPTSPQAAAPVLLQSPSGAFSPAGAGQTAFAPFSPPSEPQSPVQPSYAAPLAAQHTGDNHSIRSGRSLQSSASYAQRHPELSSPGLSSSIIETVSARFENGQLASSSLIGEIALAYHPDASVPSSGHETIRLENFGQLDKVAPNPAFIGQASGREGEYSVNLANIAKTSVAFKYQVRGEAAQSQTPVLLTPAFKLDENLAMVIVSYALHPSFAALGSDSVTLHNVTIALTLEGAKATSCQSKPVGTFSRDKNLIFWQLDEITLRPGGEANKLLAKFVTEGKPTGGYVEGRFEISGEQAQGLGSGLAVSVLGTDGAAAAADPFADESVAAAASSAAAWRNVPTQKKLTSGQYIARS